MKKIRGQYPSADGCYTGFQENSKVSETKCSWFAKTEQTDFYFFFFGQSYVRFALQATINILTTGAQQAGAGGLSFPFLI